MTLRVRHAGTDVGVLAQKERQLEFRYSAQWLDREHPFPLSPRLPLGTQPYIGEEVLFFFANLLPEGPVLDALTRLRRLPRGNTYRLLQAFGRECAGAFDLISDDDEAPSREPSYLPYGETELRADLADLRNNVPLLYRHGELRLSLAGAQNKIPVRYRDGALLLPVGGAASTHILKPALQPETEFGHSILNEAFCLRLAAALGLDVPATTILEFPEPVLLIERYDRVVDGDDVHRLHQLDFCQLSGVLPDQKYEQDGGPGFASIFERIDALSLLPARDRLQLVDWIVYNYLIGNADAHGKNASMIYDRRGKLRLAQFYDLLSTAYWPRLSDQLAMAIGGERRPQWIMARHWQRLCDALALNVAQLRRRALQHVERALTSVPVIADELRLDSKHPFVRHLHTILERRGEWLETRLVSS